MMTPSEWIESYTAFIHPVLLLSNTENYTYEDVAIVAYAIQHHCDMVDYSKFNMCATPKLTINKHNEYTCELDLTGSETVTDKLITMIIATSSGYDRVVCKTNFDRYDIEELSTLPGDIFRCIKQGNFVVHPFAMNTPDYETEEALMNRKLKMFTQSN
jgi:hypothetical protein